MILFQKKKKSKSCLENKEIKSIKVEFSLLNNNLKQLIYVNLFFFYFDMGGRNHSLNIEIISPDRMITTVIQHFFIL